MSVFSVRGMRQPGPVILLAAVVLVLAALVRDLSRQPAPVSEAKFDWTIPQPKLPWLGPLPEAPARRREVPAVITLELPPRPLGGPPPLGDAPEPPRPLPARAPDPALLAQARVLLGDQARAASLGPYSLLTDVEDPALLGLLARVAAGIEGKYRERTLLEPVGTAAEAVVLFAERDDYDAFIAGEGRLSGLRPAGHTGRGLVALAVGGRGAPEVAATLIHELAHLLNRRALGPALPPWLDEGLAEDLAAAALDADGRPVLGSFGGAVIRAAGTLTYVGGRAALVNTRRALLASEPALDLERLTAMDWETFVRAEPAGLTYSHSLLCVRTLLDSDEARAAAVFHAFLAGIAQGGSVQAETLRAELGWSWAEWNARLADLATRRAAQMDAELGAAAAGATGGGWLSCADSRSAAAARGRGGRRIPGGRGAR